MPILKPKVHIICHSPFLSYSHYLYNFFSHPGLETSFTFLIWRKTGRWGIHTSSFEMSYMVGESTAILELEKAKNRNYDFVFYIGCPVQFYKNPLPRFVKASSNKNWILKPFLYRRYGQWRIYKLGEYFLPPKTEFKELADFLWDLYPYYYLKEPKAPYLRTRTGIFFAPKNVFDQLKFEPEMEEQLEKFDLRIAHDILITRWKLPGFIQGIRSWWKFWKTESYFK